MDLGIQNKIALITGGAVGIGRAIALELAKEGANVIITSRNKEDLENTCADIQAHGVKAHGIVADTTLEGEPVRVAKEASDTLGPLDIVVNNVGDTLGVLDPLCSLEDWRRVFRLNLEVHIELNNAVIPSMKERGWGRIVNISAGASMENSGPVPYCSIKAAYTAYTRCMGRVLAKDNIVLSTVLPGVVFTERGHWAQVMIDRPEHAERYLKERTALERFGTPEEISPMVALLCSERSSFCQGGIYPVDGGQSKHYFNIDGY